MKHMPLIQATPGASVTSSTFFHAAYAEAICDCVTTPSVNGGVPKGHLAKVCTCKKVQQKRFQALLAATAAAAAAATAAAAAAAAAKVLNALQLPARRV